MNKSSVIVLSSLFAVMILSGFASAEVVVPQLTFHAVENIGQGDGYTINVSNFEAAMALLNASGVHPITLSQMFSGNPLPSKPVVIAFDDGLLSPYVNAKPILDKYGFTAVWDIVPTWVGESDTMSWAQINNVVADNMELVSHSYDHQDMYGNPNINTTLEYQVSRDIIANMTGYTPKFFLYPYNDQTAALRAVCLQYYTGCSGDSSYGFSGTNNYYMKLTDDPVILGLRREALTNINDVGMAGFKMLLPPDYLVVANVTGNSTNVSTNVTQNTTNSTQTITTGNINITTNPSGAFVYLNGNSLGSTNAYGNMFIQNVTSGNNDIAVTLIGYLPYDNIFNITANQTLNLKVVLQLNATNITGNITNSTINTSNNNITISFRIADSGFTMQNRDGLYNAIILSYKYGIKYDIALNDSNETVDDMTYKVFTNNKDVMEIEPAGYNSSLIEVPQTSSLSQSDIDAVISNINTQISSGITSISVSEHQVNLNSQDGSEQLVKDIILLNMQYPNLRFRFESQQ